MLHTPRSTRLGGRPCAPLVCSVARGTRGTSSGFGGWVAPASTRVDACASFLSFLFLAPRFHTWPQLLKRMHLCDSKRRKQGCGLVATSEHAQASAWGSGCGVSVDAWVLCAEMDMGMGIVSRSRLCLRWILPRDAQ